MSKIVIDKNFQSDKILSDKPRFTTTIKQSSVSQKISISHSFRSAKPVTRKK